VATEGDLLSGPFVDSDYTKGLQSVPKGLVTADSDLKVPRKISDVPQKKLEAPPETLKASAESLEVSHEGVKTVTEDLGNTQTAAPATDNDLSFTSKEKAPSPETKCTALMPTLVAEMRKRRICGKGRECGKVVKS
jgi:hypothetical protein